jgi:serine-type D-Ala-D-Ala carboxypeptidase (penicillin-binding protein 5/6)
VTAGTPSSRRARPAAGLLALAASLALALALALLAIPAPRAAAAAASRPPAVRAPAAILVEPATRDVVYARNADQRRPIASTTKLMTALLALERLPLDDVLSAVPYDASPAESVAGIRAGERLTVRDYLRALLVQSANDAAQTLAVRVAGSRKAFVALMNRRARQLGLHDTHYMTPVGLDVPGNYSTASDLVKLALVLRTHAFARETTDLPSVTIGTGSRTRTFRNQNGLVRTVPWVNGVKTGHTHGAGYVLVGSGTRDGVTVLSAVLGDPTDTAREQDSLALLRYGLGRYHLVHPVTKGRRYAAARLTYRDQDVPLVASRTIGLVTRRGERPRITVTGAPAKVDGPVAQGTRVGTIVVRRRGEVVDRVALVTGEAVSAASAVQRLQHLIGSAVVLLLLAIFAGGSLGLVLLRRRAVRRRRGPVGGTETA